MEGSTLGRTFTSGLGEQTPSPKGISVKEGETSQGDTMLQEKVVLPGRTGDEESSIEQIPWEAEVSNVSIAGDLPQQLAASTKLPDDELTDFAHRFRVNGMDQQMEVELGIGTNEATQPGSGMREGPKAPQSVSMSIGDATLTNGRMEQIDRQAGHKLGMIVRAELETDRGICLAIVDPNVQRTMQGTVRVCRLNERSNG